MGRARAPRDLPRYSARRVVGGARSNGRRDRGHLARPPRRLLLPAITEAHAGSVHTRMGTYVRVSTRARTCAARPPPAPPGCPPELAPPPPRPPRAWPRPRPRHPTYSRNGILVPARLTTTMATTTATHRLYPPEAGRWRLRRALRRLSATPEVADRHGHWPPPRLGSGPTPRLRTPLRCRRRRRRARATSLGCGLLVALLLLLLLQDGGEWRWRRRGSDPPPAIAQRKLEDGVRRWLRLRLRRGLLLLLRWRRWRSLLLLNVGQRSHCPWPCLAPHGGRWTAPRPAVRPAVRHDALRPSAALVRRRVALRQRPELLLLPPLALARLRQRRPLVPLALQRRRRHPQQRGGGGRGEARGRSGARGFVEEQRSQRAGEWAGGAAGLEAGGWREAGGRAGGGARGDRAAGRAGCGGGGGELGAGEQQLV